MQQKYPEPTYLKHWHTFFVGVTIQNFRLYHYIEKNLILVINGN